MFLVRENEIAKPGQICYNVEIVADIVRGNSVYL